MKARKPRLLVLHVADAPHVLDALGDRLDVAVHHRGRRRHAQAVRVAHDAEPLVGLRLLRRDDLAHAVDEHLAAAAGQGVQFQQSDPVTRCSQCVRRLDSVTGARCPCREVHDRRRASPEADAERRRLAEARDGDAPWRLWGPYLSERQWGTVREDYSDDGDAWSYFSHDQARSRAYRSGEDGIAGYSDDRQILCFALALWNGRDPILKERLFGLTNGEGNHGEDVKEYYFYDDATPTNSYLRTLVQVPAGAFPVRRPRRDQCESRSDRSRVRAPRHRRLRRRPLLRRRGGVRQGEPDRYRDPHHRDEPRPGARRPSTSCRRSGSATPGRGAATNRGRRCAGPRSAEPGSSRPLTPSSASTG